MQHQAHDNLTIRLIDSLYSETMLLADEVRAYFDADCPDRDRLPPGDRVIFACESLKVTTRLMHVVAWLLARRGVEARVPARLARDPARLGEAADSDDATIARMTEPARVLIEASRDLYERVRRLDQEEGPMIVASPARTLFERLQHAF